MSILLAREGFSCYLGSKSNIYHLTKHLKNYIYLDKGYHAGESEPLYKQIQENNGVIVNLDEEGAVDFSDNSTLKERYADPLFEYAKTVFLWGTEQQELIYQQTGSAYKTIVTGHPRFELLKPEYHFLYESEVNSIIRRYCSFILVNTNMGFGNNIKGDEFVISNYGSRFENIRKIVKFDKIKVEAYLELIRELSGKTKKKVILRPHPEEDLHFYVKAFEGIENIEVIFNGSVVPWLLAAEEVIHPDCTTAIESAFLGKSPISYMPEKHAEDIVTKLPLEVSIRFTNVSELVDHLMNKKVQPNDENNRYKVLDDYFSLKQSALQMIVSELARIRKEMGNTEVQKDLRKEFFLLRIKESINSLRNNSDLYFARKKLHGFDYANIKSIQDLLFRNVGLSGVSVKKYNKGLFLFKESDY